ncbi:MAG: hypothetical protein KGJ98_10345 [Chloroflexota bacterium]|nr:hypothetical protein [Chloroflexota bacterium]
MLVCKPSREVPFGVAHEVLELDQRIVGFRTGRRTGLEQKEVAAASGFEPLAALAAAEHQRAMDLVVPESGLVVTAHGTNTVGAEQPADAARVGVRDQAKLSATDPINEPERHTLDVPRTARGGPVLRFDERVDVVW